MISWRRRVGFGAVALDGVFGIVAAAPLPRTGDRISFFWTEEDGWWDCEVVERGPRLHSMGRRRVHFPTRDDNAVRWRPSRGAAAEAVGAAEAGALATIQQLRNHVAAPR